VLRRLDLEAIKKAATTEIERYGQTFSATPFEAVLKLAAIPVTARIRVIGEEEEMVLQAGSNEESPARYFVVFNLRGFPVLTPNPDASSPAPLQAGRNRAAALPPAGSGGGARVDPTDTLPPPGSGRGQRRQAQEPPADGQLPLPPPGSGRAVGGGPGTGGGTGQGPGRPDGFAPLREVRSFTRIQIEN
jgi:hypothetical protein